MSGGDGSIVITGASSGIGAALAASYAVPGAVLFLTGRDSERLRQVAELCRAQGASVTADTVDVADRQAMCDWLIAAEARAPIGLIIANAGISAGTGQATGESEEQARAIFAVNVDGVLNTILPAIPFMQARRAGQIALVSSLASFRGLPGAPAYAGSKAAVRVWGEGLRGWMAEHGIRVSVVCPGFVTSRMTARNTFPMPFLWSADKAARVIRAGLERNKGRISFPWPLMAGVWLLAALPPGLVDLLVRRLPRKAG